MIKKNPKLFMPVAFVLMLLPASVSAQSIGSFSTRPYMPPPPPNTVEMPQYSPVLVAPPAPTMHAHPSNSAPKIVAATAVPKSSASAPAEAVPVVMFTPTYIHEPPQAVYWGTNPNYNPSMSAELPNQYVASAMTEQSSPIPKARRRHFWDPLPKRLTPAPTIIPQSVKGFYADVTRDPNAPIDPNRGPMKAIVQDTSRAIVRDVPQALADVLPWVDNTRKQEPFESVLSRVSDNLSRADASDPEWAAPAQSEIRELATRLDRLAAPPQYKAEYSPVSQKLASNEALPARPFHARPIWPGANARAETQMRPIAIVSTTNDEIGNMSSGQDIAVPKDYESAPPAPAKRAQSRRARRPIRH